VRADSPRSGAQNILPEVTAQALLNYYRTVAAGISGLLRNAVFRLYMTVRALWAPTTLGAAALVLDAEGRVLLVRHSYNPGWRLPGGGVGRGEPPAEAVLRELAEEVGLGGGSAAFVSLHTKGAGWATMVVALYRVTGASVAFRPNLEIREICFADPRQPPAGCTPATLRRLAEFTGQAPLSPYW
jgi:8-oxo-dGTP pyrophosphatase MutT (NUDIX family)